MTITGYRCDKCGHWNDLKRRKPKAQKPDPKEGASLPARATEGRVG